VLPAITVTLAGVAATVKEGAPVTVRAIDTVFRSVPEVPVTVTVAGPEAADELAAKVKVLAPDAFAGLNWAVTPAGSPETVKATAELKPF